jgi:phenylpropionate dioxygenase-like ring-hydroxylating dioxygenase large terminal subunit
VPQKFNYIDFSKEIPSLPRKSASLSKDRYISEDFMEMEWNGIWAKTWLFAGIESDIKEIGDFFFTILAESQL